MRSVRSLILVLAVVAFLSLASGCICVSEEHVASPSMHRNTGKLTIAVDEESVDTYGPVAVHIDVKFYGHVVKNTDFDLEPGTHSLRLERKGLPTYSALVTISREIPVLIIAPSKP